MKDLFSHKTKQAGVVFLLTFLIPIRCRAELFLKSKDAGQGVTKKLFIKRFQKDTSRILELITIWDKLEGIKQTGLYSGLMYRGEASISPAS